MGASGKRFLFLASWTGGGHFAAARAISLALSDLDPASRASSVDVLQHYAPPPFPSFPRLYALLVSRAPWLYSATFALTDSPPVAGALSALCFPLAARRLRAMLDEHHPDVLVVVHPLLVRPALRLARERPGLRVACVATDLVHLHSLWLAPGADLYCVASEPAARQSLDHGLDPQRLVVAGQPILCHRGLPTSKAAARAALGLEREPPLALLIAGADGVGPLEETAAALEGCGAPLQLAVVCGRNDRVRRRLAGRGWRVPVTVAGFVEDMPLWLRAADVLVTKAGPGTLAEGLAEGLPTVIAQALPGQERANVRHLCQAGAAVWAPSPRRAAEAVAGILSRPALRRELSLRARALARPEAARVIARHLLGLLATEPGQDVVAAAGRTVAAERITSL